MNLHTESWKGFLYAVPDGAVDLESYWQLLEQTAEIAAKKGLSGILVDGRLLSGNISTTERHELAVRAKEYFDERGTHPTVAIVGHAPTYNGIGVLAAQEQGIVVRLFSSLSDAIEWIGEVQVLHH